MILTIRLSCFCLCCMIVPLAGMAQTPFSRVIVGKVLADDTGLPLPYAHLSVGSNAIGTLCNDIGAFKLNIPRQLAADTIRISYLGYAPTVLALNRIDKDSILIRLEPEYLELEPVEIPSISPRDTIKKAWTSRGLNYEIKPTLLRGFYREQMEDRGLDIEFLFAEGVLELYKSPYHRSNRDRVRVLKGRKKALPKGYQKGGKTYLLPLLTQGPHLGIVLDLLKDEVSFVRKSKQGSYHYEFLEVQYLNQRLTYLFSFFPKAPSDKYVHYEGRIYIDVESLAFVRAEYDLTPAGIGLFNESTENLILHSRSFVVNYMLYKDRWYLRDARVDNQYAFPQLERSLYSSHTFLTTEIANDQVNAFPKTRGLLLHDTFVEEVQTLDTRFWEDYQIVPLDEKDQD